MGNKTEEREILENIIIQLKKTRTEIVTLKVQISKIIQKIKMIDLEARRLESTTVMEVYRAKLDNGHSAYPEEWTRKARVEEILARHERFNTLLRQRSLLQKQYVRKEKLKDLTDIKIDDLESREKITVLA